MKPFDMHDRLVREKPKDRKIELSPSQFNDKIEELIQRRCDLHGRFIRTEFLRLVSAALPEINTEYVPTGRAMSDRFYKAHMADALDFFDKAVEYADKIGKQ